MGKGAVMQWAKIYANYFACSGEGRLALDVFSKELDARADDLELWLNTGRV